MKSDVLWSPSTQFKEESNLKQYEFWLKEKHKLSFDSYESLLEWTVGNVASFWESLWEYFDIIHHSPYETVLRDEGMPDVQWFPGSTINYAEHVFRMKSDSRPALLFQNESERKEISWSQLESGVLRFQDYLISLGLKKGDCIAAYIPNIPEAIVCFLAANSLGIIWSCCSPDFGVDTVIERFSQIQPKLLIACDGYMYNQKRYSRVDELKLIKEHLPSLKQVVFIPYLDQDANFAESTLWSEIPESSEKELNFTPVPFSHPIWVLYSSGTTGKPKAITHSHGGVLLEHLKYLTFQNDVKVGEHFFWFSTTGWMMWNFLQASLLAGATAVLFDGSPAYPDLDVLWKMTEELPIHHFGTSAPYLTACMKRNLRPGEKYDLSKLRSIGSTGAPLPPEAFDWVYKSVSNDVWLCSMSGGTDVCTAFVGSNPYAEVIKGRIQSRALGCALQSFDDEGNHMTNSLGEMVITEPMPSMPIYFWNDPEDKRYRSSYFENFPGKWRHGDWIKIFDDGSLIIQGRSDSTLNRKGIRIGTAEIYNVLNHVSGIKDALVINIERPDGSDVMPLFVVLDEDVELGVEMKQNIVSSLRTQCSPRHVPDEIIQVPDIPYTLSGKKMEVPVKKLFIKTKSLKSVNREAIKNPAAMDFFIDYAANFNKE